MFDINGGGWNVATMFILLSTLIGCIGIPALIAMIERSDGTLRIWPSIVAGILGFGIWFLFLYIANPSLTFWKVS